MNSPKLLFSLLIILLTMIPKSTATLNTGSDAPYIYYYAHAENAFVAERADGSDRYTLFEYDLPDDIPDYELRGPGWSPSGQWFAWVAFMASPVYIGDRSDGTVREVEMPGRIIAHEWSSAEDRLLVEIDLEGEFRSYIIDPKNPDHRTSVPSTLQWSPTGEHLYDIRDGVGTIFDLSGEVLLQFEVFRGVFGWVGDRFLYRVSDNIIVFGDVLNPAALRYEFREDILAIDWHQAQQTGLVYVILPSSGRVDLWLISVDEDAYYPISKNVRPDTLHGTTWSPSGNAAWFYTEDFGLNIVEKVNDKYTVSTLPDIGRPIDVSFFDSMQWLDDDKLLIATNEGTFTYNIRSGDLETLDVTTGPFVLSADRRYIAGIFCPTEPLTPDTFCVYDMLTGEQATIPPYSDSKWEQIVEGFVDWHPKEPWMIIGETQTSPWMLLRTVNADGSIEHAIDVECIQMNRACFGWLP